MSKFKIGDKIRKPKGYSFDGTVVSVFTTTSGDVRVVAELDGNGMLHIFSEGQLELRDDGDMKIMSSKVVSKTYITYLEYDGVEYVREENMLDGETLNHNIAWRSRDHEVLYHYYSDSGGWSDKNGYLGFGEPAPKLEIEYQKVFREGYNKLFDELENLDSNLIWWNLDQDGFSIYLNCNDLSKGTAYGLCLYNGVYIDWGIRIDLIIREGLSFFYDFMANHKKDLDLFYEEYNFAALDVLIEKVQDFKLKYNLKYDLKEKPLNPFK